MAVESKCVQFPDAFRKQASGASNKRRIKMCLKCYLYY